MNKKGFISISIIYSFFLVFIAIVLGIMLMYSSRRMTMLEIEEDVRSLIDENSMLDCYEMGITKLNKCVIYTYGGEDFIKAQETPSNSSAIGEGEYGLYVAQDDFGDSYYFRGDVPNNYVKFGQNANGEDMYWRIVRINGDGTIRLIYDGTKAVDNSTKHNNAIGSIKFNLNDNDPKYVGYTYDDGSGNQIDSNVKSFVESWYELNLDKYDSYISDGIFCNDRNQNLSNSGDEIRFAFYSRSSNPKLTCDNNEDKYTVSNSIGNGLLSYPIGLLTADERQLAGVRGNYSYHYLKNSNSYIWTMTPYLYTISTNHCRVLGFSVYSTQHSCASANGVRPVINLNQYVNIAEGDGTVTSPYVLEGGRVI